MIFMSGSCRLACRHDPGEHGGFQVAPTRCWSGGCRLRLGNAERSAAEYLMERADQGDGARVGKLVEDLLGFPSRFDDPALPQLRELLRQAWLAHAERRFDLADRPLSLNEKANNHQPIWIGESLHELARGLGFLAGDCRIAVW